MRIAQPVANHSGDHGYLVYEASGVVVCFVQVQPGPTVALESVIGPHLALRTTIMVSTRQWHQWQLRAPGPGVAGAHG